MLCVLYVSMPWILSFFLTVAAASWIYTLSLHDALPISVGVAEESHLADARVERLAGETFDTRSEEHTSELQSLRHLVCRLLLEKKKLVRNQLRNSTPTVGLPPYAQ